MDDLPIYLSALTSTITVLGAIFGAVRWLAGKLQLLDQIPVLTSKVERLEREVQEAIGVKRHMSEMLTRLATLEHIVSGIVK